MTETDSEQTSSGRSPEGDDENHQREQSEHSDSGTEQEGELEDVQAENDVLRERIADLESTVEELASALDGNEGGPEASSTGQEAPDASDGEGGADGTPELATSGGQPYKVFGPISDEDGIGVLGSATGDATVGVRGTVESEDGHGLHTPDDASVEGDLDVGGDVRIELSGDLFPTGVLRFAQGGPYIRYSSSFNWFQIRNAARFELDMNLSVNDASPQRTAGPIAKGSVGLDDGLADLENAVNIDDVTWRSDEEDFEVELAHVDEYSFTDYAVQAIPVSPIAVANGTSDDDNLVIEFEGGTQMPFQLVVWELPDGEETTGD